MVHEGLITMENAIMRITSDQHDQILHPMIDPNAIYTIITQGLPASPGAACGEIVFSPEEARRYKKDGRKVILVRIETSPEDIDGMHAAGGILTARGGMTSHAALVARGMGKPCVCGAEAIQIDYENKCFVVGGKRYSMGDTITLDGSSGRVLNGRVPMINAEPTAEYLELMQWADKTRRLKVRANAEAPEDARTARRHGAEGIGLSRTEHMFFEGERIVAVREMILADDAQGRLRALAKILPMQRDDFKEIFTIMSGLPVTIRLLDPPLHEFLPHTEAEIRNVAWAMKVDPEKLRQRAHQLGEFNPMLGFRGVRLAIAYPEIAQMQARAILEGALAAYRNTSIVPQIEIMIPLLFSRRELDLVKARIDAIAHDVAEKNGIELPYMIGSMIELPTAALRAGEIAQTAEFLSFGTNDLTQTGLGVSRDDSGRFLGTYVDQGILHADPFATIEQTGIGELVEIGVKRARKVRPTIKIGICGEHGGDPESIKFFDGVGFDYVSCSPFRVPIARLAAAQATIASRNGTTK
jgi:pyruvate,orthophosphate dikinase